MDRQALTQYAKVAIDIGLGLQSGQPLVIGYQLRPALPDHLEFVRILTEYAYERGASYVHIDWGDEHWMRLAAQHASQSLLRERAERQAAWTQRLAEEGAAFLAIACPDPNLYRGVDGDKIKHFTTLYASTHQAFNEARMSDLYPWSLIGVPSQAWADVVYPELDASARVEVMWRDILSCARADGLDPVTDWQEHLSRLQRRCDWLTSMSVQSFHYQAPGTDLSVRMAPHHYFSTAYHRRSATSAFVSNIPTEEVYSTPDYAGVDGVVSSTMPLNYNGQVIDGLRLRFHAGRIVESTAAVGEEALQHLLATDEGSHYLGEVAFVPVNSPIAKRQRLYYNTLFDENASCHLAIGNAYPLVQGGHDLSRSEWGEHGLNRSLAHVDFMVGSANLSVDAITTAGDEVAVLRNGCFVTDV